LGFGLLAFIILHHVGKTAPSSCANRVEDKPREKSLAFCDRAASEKWYTTERLLLSSRDVRFGSKADICGATSHVRFTPIATAKADFRTRSCLLYPRKRTCAVQRPMSALGHKRTSNKRRPFMNYCFLNGLCSGVPQKYDKLGSLIVVHDLPGLVAQNGNGQLSVVAVRFFFSFAPAFGTACFLKGVFV
jgi:hypothetical protein